MTITLIPVFTYGDCKVRKSMKKACERYFMDARNRAVKLLNPHFEEWNNEFNAQNETMDEQKYGWFIQEKMQTILTEVNRILDYPVKLHADEDGNIIGRFFYKGALVTMHMELLEPKQ